MADAKPIRQKIKSSNPTGSYFHNIFLNQKLNNWIGFFLLAVIALGVGFLTAKGLTFGIGLLGLVLGSFTLIACILSPELGIYINMVYIFFCYHFTRLFYFEEFPVGVVSDILVAVTFLSLFVKGHDIRANAGRFFNRKPVLFLCAAFLYLCLQLFNPLAHSFEGWSSVIRKVLASIIIMFVAYNVFTDLKKIWTFVRVLFVCAVLIAIYGCIQQWHGLFGFEEVWVKSNEVRFGLIYVGWSYRKFSVLSDPTALGIVLATCVLFFLIVGINERKGIYKALSLGGSLLMILAMAYSGTRTAYVMMVGGVGLYILLTFQKKVTKAFALFSVLAFLFLLYVPIYDNPTLIRFRTAFSGNDESYLVREANRAGIRPYVYSHPVGGGLSTTGANGEKYNPGHYLAGFPPDSGYLNKALETGWIGLIINCLVYFFTLQYAVAGYFRTKHAGIKTLFAASAAFLFSLYIAELGQEAVGMFSNLVLYSAVVAMVIRLRELGAPSTGSAKQELSN